MTGFKDEHNEEIGHYGRTLIKTLADFRIKNIINTFYKLLRSSIFAKKLIYTREKIMAKNYVTENKKVNLIENGTKIKGDIESNGDFRIDGTLVGSIKSKGKIVVGTTGTVEGDISCRNADISGKVKAHVNITELLSLKSSADISGDIKTAKLSIEPGAKFTGTCDMGNAQDVDIKYSSNNNEKAKSKEKIA